jgi:hypothetical protein
VLEVHRVGGREKYQRREDVLGQPLFIIMKWIRMVRSVTSIEEGAVTSVGR